MEAITNDYISTNTNSSTSLPQIFLSQSLTSILAQMQRTQHETNKRLDQLYNYISKTSHNSIYHIESFTISIPAQDKINIITLSPTTRSPYKRLHGSSQSIQYNKSPDTFFQLKRFTEDEPEIEEKRLYRVKSDTDIKEEVKKEMLLEENEVLLCAHRYENVSSHRTSETIASMHSNTSNNSKEKKIRGFNFKNKIDLNEQNHYQPKRRSTYDAIRSHKNNIVDMYNPYNPANMIITTFNEDSNIINVGNICNPTLNKPQIISEKHAKRYWNISMTKIKPNQIQQRLKHNLTKLINNKKEIA